jgi:hypothetical protein
MVADYGPYPILPARCSNSPCPLMAPLLYERTRLFPLQAHCWNCWRSRRRRVAAWTRLCPAGALATGGFVRSRRRLRRTRAGHIFINEYSTAVSPFDRLRSGRSRIDEKLMGSTASLLSPKSQTVASYKKATLRARDSVRRASDFVQIAMTLIDPVVGVIARVTLHQADS